MAAYFNSKFWYLHHYCSSNMYGYFNCEDNGFETLDAQIADGVSAYGFGWDLRPPRVLFNVPPDGMPVLVDASGAAHPMRPYEPWATSGRSLGRNRDGIGDEYFTVDGTNYRFTVRDVDALGRPVNLRMEDGQGAVFIFSQVVPGGPQGCAANYSSLDPEDSLETVNFRHEVAGLYLKEIQRGPWTGGPDGGTPANKIEFFYAAENPGSWLAACGGIGAEQWLVTTITASGEVPRTVNLLYGVADTTRVLTQITVPSFDPTLGNNSSAPKTAAISWTTQLSQFEQLNAGHSHSFEAPHLTEIALPEGVIFSFDTLDGSLPLNDVTLPSGARVEYLREEAFPLGTRKYVPGIRPGGGAGDEPDDSGPRAYTCGLTVNPPNEGNYPGRGTWTKHTYGVVRRTITYRDASTDLGGTPRVENTWFAQALDCDCVPGFDAGAATNEWPYDFRYALQSDLGIGGSELRKDYLWTVVWSHSGELPSDPDDLVEISEIEVHRFHPLTREEFSVDVLSGSQAALYHFAFATLLGSPRNEVFDEPVYGPARRIRHTEIERDVLPGHPDVKNLSSPRYTYVSRVSTFTDETDFQTSTADIRDCYDWVVPGSPPNITCAEARKTTTEVDEFLNPLQIQTQSLNTYTLSVHRTKKWLTRRRTSTRRTTSRRGRGRSTARPHGA